MQDIPKLVILASQTTPAAPPASMLEPDCDCPGGAIAALVDSQQAAEALLPRLASDPCREIRLRKDALLARVDEDHWAGLGAECGQVVVFDERVSRLLSLLPSSREALEQGLGAWPAGALDGALAALLATGLVSSPQVAMPPARFLPADTLSAWVHVSEACSMACSYCYARRSSRQMSEEVAREAVRALFRAAEAHGFNRVKIKFGGGEPTLNLRALRAAMRQAEALREGSGVALEAVLLTNGVSLSDEQADYLAAHQIRAAVSLDGLGADQDGQRPCPGSEDSSAARVLGNIARMRARGISVSVSVTLTRRNLRGLPELAALLLERELPFGLSFYRPPEPRAADPLAFSSEEAVQALSETFAVVEAHLPGSGLLPSLADRASLRAPHQRTCGVGENYLAIGCTGEIFACQMEVGGGRPLGTIAERDILACVREEGAGLGNPPVERKECAGCPWRYYCTGGCPRLAYQQAGRYEARSPFCEVYRAILPQVMRLEALRLLAETRQRSSEHGSN